MIEEYEMATVTLGDETSLSTQTKPLWATHLGPKRDKTL